MPGLSFGALVSVAFGAAPAPDLVRVVLEGEVGSQGLDGTALLEVADGPAPLVFDAVGLTIRTVRVDGVETTFTYDGDRLTVPTAGGVRVEVDYSAPPSDALVVDGGFVSTQFSTWRWIPCVEAPSERARFEARLRVPDGHVLITDGDGEAPAYLWAFASGPYERHEHGRSVVWTPRGREVIAALHAAGDTERVLAWTERLTGLPYAERTYQTVYTPYATAQEFIGGAFIGLEHVERSPKADGDVPWYTAHEALHQWFGVQLPIASWSDHWVNEAFATYGAVLVQGREEALEAFALRKAEAAASWRERRPALHVEPAPRFGDGVGGGAVYSVGPLVLHGIRTDLGPKRFRAVVRRYAEAPSGTAALERALGDVPLPTAVRGQ